MYEVMKCPRSILKVLCVYSFNFTPGYNKISKFNDVKTFLTETFHLNILQPDRDRKHSRFSDCFKYSNSLAKNKHNSLIMIRLDTFASPIYDKVIKSTSAAEEKV